MATDKEIGGIMAGSLIASSMLDHLIAKGIFSIYEARKVVEHAKEALGDHTTPMNAAEREAFRILEWFLRERYAAP